jgi:hypothetical protein
VTATTHVETEQVQGRRLGRRPHDPSVETLRLANYLTGVVPAHPAAADHFSRVTDWGMFENDRFGVCGPTSVANMVKMVTKYLGGNEVTVTQDDVFALYRLCNPDFDPVTGAGDNGVDMKQMLSFLVKNGIGGRKALAFAAVDTSNLDEVRAAISLFGGVLLGVDLEVAQQNQTNAGLWDYSPSSEWGGHAILAGFYTSDSSPGREDIAVVTWAEVVGTTDVFAVHQLQEAYVVVWREHLGAVEFQQGVNLSALAADYEALTQRPFPVQPGPQPVPDPTPVPAPPVVDPADGVLVADLRHWLSEHHTGDNRRAAAAVVKWMSAKGLTLTS